MPNYETMEIFARKLTALLEERDIPQYALAQHLGVSNSTVCSWCNGLKMPRMNRVEQMAEFFGVPLRDLLAEQSAPAEVLEEVDVAFYGDYRSLSEDDRQTIRDMVAVMRRRRKKTQEKI